jgi:VWFA-related protein
VRALIALFVLALTWAVPAAGAEDEPAQIDYTEEVQVRLVQVDATVWPKDGATGSCAGLTPTDFEVLVDGEPRRVVWVDRLASTEEGTAEEQAVRPAPSRSALRIVLYFDLWHLDVMRAGFDACPATRMLAFNEARRMLREGFLPGDEVLLVTFAGWPNIHHGWISDREEALRALDRLEVDPAVRSCPIPHTSHKSWIEGMSSLLLALGRYPEPKDLIYLADDFRFDDEVALSLGDLAARAQANNVTLHAVDLLWTCRSVPGPGCPGFRRGGLQCSPWRTPVILGQVAANLGGRLFLSDSVAIAVQQLRQSCRYRISFDAPPERKRREPPRIVVQLGRDDLTLYAPTSFEGPSHAPNERDEQDALFLLPRFGQGLDLEAGLWPLRPAEGKRKKSSWDALLLTRLRRVPHEPWPDDLSQIVLDAAAYRGGKIYGKFRKIVEREDLQRLRDSGESSLLVFPIESVRQGEAIVAVRAQGKAADGEVAASLHVQQTVPEPPGPGEARPWFLADRLGRASSTVTLLPSLDGLLPADREAWIVGYACDTDQTRSSEAPGRLLSIDGNLSVPVPIAWLDPSRPNACGWLAGLVERGLSPGLWRFEPPETFRAGADARVGVEFRVVAADPDGAAAP